MFTSTAGLDVQYEPTKKLPTNQKGFDNSETTVEKLSVRRIQIYRVFFSEILFDLLIFKTSGNMAPTKIDLADLDSLRRELFNGGLRIVVTLLVRRQINVVCASR